MAVLKERGGWGPVLWQQSSMKISNRSGTMPCSLMDLGPDYTGVVSDCSYSGRNAVNSLIDQSYAGHRFFVTLPGGEIAKS